MTEEFLKTTVNLILTLPAKIVGTRVQQESVSYSPEG